MSQLTTIQQYININTKNDYFPFKETIEETGGYSDAIKYLIEDRLSTVKNVDRLFYIESGRIISSGTFSELKAAIPHFEQQIAFSQIKE